MYICRHAKILMPLACIEKAERASLFLPFFFPFPLPFYYSSFALVFSSYATFFCTCMLIRRSLQGSCLSCTLLFVCKGYTIYSLSWRRFSRREEAGPPSNSLTYTLGNPRSQISRSSYNPPASHPFCVLVNLHQTRSGILCMFGAAESRIRG